MMGIGPTPLGPGVSGVALARDEATHRTAEAEVVPEPGSQAIPHRSGWIDFVPVAGESPAAEDSWTLTWTPDGRSRLVTSADARGRIELEAGAYTISTQSGSRRVQPDAFRVEAGSGTTLWVGGSRVLIVNVRDTTDAPLADAAVTWTHLGERGRPEDRRLSASATTDSDGRASVPIEGPVARGRLVVQRVGYRSVVLQFVAAPTAPLRVVLEVETAVQLAGRVLDCESGSALPGVDVLDGQGQRLATSAQDGSVELPEGIGRHGALRLSGDSVASGWIEAPTAADFRLCAVPLVHQVIRWGGSTPPTRLELVLFASDNAGGCSLEAERRSESSESSSVEVLLPRGTRVLVQAEDAIGRRGYAEFRVNDRPLPVDLLGLESANSLVLDLDVTSTAECTVEPIYDARQGWRVAPDATGAFAIPFASEVRRVFLRVPGCVPLVLGRVPGSRETRSGRVRVRPSLAARCELELRDELGAPLAGVRVRTAVERGTVNPVVDGPSGAQPTDHPAWCLYEDSNTEFVTNQVGIATLAPITPGFHTVSIGTPAYFRVAVGSDLYQQQFRNLLVPEGMSRVDWIVPRPTPLLVECVAAGTMLPVTGVEARLEGGLANTIASATGNYWHGWVPRNATRVLLSAKGYDNVQLELPPKGSAESEWFARVEFHPGNDGRIFIREVSPEAISGRTLRLIAEEQVGDVWVVRWNGSVDVKPDGTIDLALPLDEACLSLNDAGSPAVYSFQPRRQAWVRGQVVDVIARAIR